MKLKACLVKAAGILLGLSWLAGNTWAIGELLPGAVLPGQVSEALSKQQATEAHPRPPASVVSKSEAPTGGLGPQAAKIKFQLNKVILEGNHIYTEEQLLILYKNDLHKTITIARLFEIVQSITNFYRNNGYIISRAILPPQRVKKGVVRIQIIEGFIDQVTVTGHPMGARCIIRAYGERIKADPPLEISRMEKYLLLANELPATQVKAVLSPAKKPGAADLSLVSEHHLVTGYVSYDDYGTRYIGPQQMTANLALNSIFASGDATQVTVVKTPKGKELTYTDLNYYAPISSGGINWLIGGTRAETNPLFVLAPIKINGLNSNYYTTVQYPIIRSRTQSLTLRTGFNYLDSTVTALNQELYTDHLRSLDLGGTYFFADRWYGSNVMSADLRQGLPIWGYTSDTNVATALTSRPGASGEYTKITLQLSRLQAVKGPVTLYGALSGQWAFNPLLSSEQFAFGGPLLGRGYDIAELIGDRGAAGSLEARYDLGIDRLIMKSLQFYIFYDAGMIYNLRKLPGTIQKASGTSTGIGARLYMTKYVSGNVMWTQTLTKQVAAEELIGDGRRPRVFFSVVATLA